jgi:DNA-binding NarL/FixJ family response regulator
MVTRVQCPTCGQVCASTAIARHRRFHDDPSSLLAATVEQQAEIVRLYKRGYSLQRIADEKFFARSSVRRVLIANGIAMRPQGGPHPAQRLSAEDTLRTAELYGKGLSMAELAEVLGLSISAVHRRLHVIGVQIRKRGGDHRSNTARARRERMARAMDGDAVH